MNSEPLLHMVVKGNSEYETGAGVWCMLLELALPFLKIYLISASLISPHNPSLDMQISNDTVGSLSHLLVG